MAIFTIGSPATDPALNGRVTVVETDLADLLAQLSTLDASLATALERIASLEGNGGGGGGPLTSSVRALATLLLHGGGTHNMGAYSPDGSLFGAAADVGATRYFDFGSGDTEFKYLPTRGNNGSRQVAGLAISNAGIIYQLVGNFATSGELQKIDTQTKQVSLLKGNLNILANDKSGASDGLGADTGARPRPVGWMVLYDQGANVIYYCTEEGVGAYNLNNNTDRGIIALSGVSCRGFAHLNHAVGDSETEIFVCTRTRGLVMLRDPIASPVEYRVSPSSYSRFEDAAFINKTNQSILGACHEQGVYRYSANGRLALNQLRIDGPVIPADVRTDRYSLEWEGTTDWSATTTGDLIGAWGTAVGDQCMRLRLNNGFLRLDIRFAATSGLYILASDVAMNEGITELAVRARITGQETAVLEKKAPGGSWVQIGQGSLGGNYPFGTLQNLTIGQTAGGTAPLPAGSIFKRASMTKFGSTRPTFSIDVSGALAGATSHTGINGDAWTWPAGMNLTTGGFNARPSQAAAGNGTVNGSPCRWTAVASHMVAGTPMAALAAVNPSSPTEWVYRAQNANTVTTAGWEDATPNTAVKNLGSGILSPTARVLGDSIGADSDNLVGVYSLAFDPSDDSGNTVIAAAALSLYRTQSFAGTRASISWETFNPGLSMVSIAATHIDWDGNLLVTLADHNIYGWSAADLLTGEPAHPDISGIRDGWSVYSVGSGADKVTVFCPADDKAPENPKNAPYFHRGAGVPDGWNETGYRNNFTGRVGGVFGWDNGDGTYGFVVWGETHGWVRSTYTLSSGTWSTWQAMTTGPTADLVTDNQLQERQIVGADDGSVIFAIQLATGHIWRSLDKAVTWTRLSAYPGSLQEQRSGRIAYIPSTDTLAASNKDRLFRINNASSSADVTEIGGITTACMLAVGSANRLYVHIRGSGPIELVRFDDFSQANDKSDGTQVAEAPYRNRVGDLACSMTSGISGGKEYIVTGYQGSGVYIQEVVNE